MTAYYNEIDPYAAQWLRNLIAAGHIAPGDVDTRSIRDVKADDLRGYTQCHFFAGIGVWSYALWLAGWPDDKPVWTGSCPCQPFSAAGKQAGFEDDRHLWPDFFRLIDARRPPVIFGEQVAAKVGLAWLDLVHADLEGAGYTVRAADTCAAGVGAPHIRQRLYFVADDNATRCGVERSAGLLNSERAARRHNADRRGEAGELADGQTGRRSEEHSKPRRGDEGNGAQGGERPVGGHGPGVAQGDTDDAGSQGRRVSGTDRERECSRERAVGEAGSADRVEITESDRRDGPLQSSERQEVSGVLAASAGSSTAGFWSACDWLPCIDGKARPVEPGTFPLAHGAPARVGRLRAYGNAIVAEQARHFIEAADLL